MSSLVLRFILGLDDLDGRMVHFALRHADNSPCACESQAVAAEDVPEDVEIHAPAKWSICRSCRGHGRSSAYLGAITAEDREPGGAWEDPEDFACYMRGEYDRHCPACDGNGKIVVADHNAMAPPLRALWCEWARREAADRRERESEARGY